VAAAIYPVNAVVSRDVVPIGEVARDLIVDNLPGDRSNLAKDDAEELMRWPLKRMKVAREGDIAVCYSVMVSRIVDYGE
jgi:hypothetical protein